MHFGANFMRAGREYLERPKDFCVQKSAEIIRKYLCDPYQKLAENAGCCM